MKITCFILGTVSLIMSFIAGEGHWGIVLTIYGCYFFLLSLQKE